MLVVPAHMLWTLPLWWIPHNFLCHYLYLSTWRISPKSLCLHSLTDEMIANVPWEDLSVNDWWKFTYKYPASSFLRWDNTKAHFLHHSVMFLHGNGLQGPMILASLKTHPFIGCFPCISPQFPPGFPILPSPMNHLHSNPCLESASGESTHLLCTRHCTGIYWLKNHQIIRFQTPVTGW